jgi:hypothetical protein
MRFCKRALAITALTLCCCALAGAAAPAADAARKSHKLMDELRCRVADQTAQRTVRGVAGPSAAEQPGLRGDDVDLLTRAWQTGDLAIVEEVTTSEVRNYPQLAPLMTKLLDDRNTAMTAKIERFLQTPERYFVAVGAGHLVGDNGILSQLRRKNFKLEQL